MTEPITTSSNSALANKATGDKSLGELVQTATKDMSLLIRQEVELAKAEIKQEVKTAGQGAGLFGGAGFAGVFALVFLSIAAAYGISWLGPDLGWGFLAVGLLYTVVAVALAVVGKKKLGQVRAPATSIGSVKEDVAWAKHPTRPS